MGWSWAGASEWLSEKKAEEREREKWELARKDKLVGLVLPELIARREARAAKAAESRARISTADSYGMDVEAAAILEASGQLPSLLSRLEKIEQDPDRTLNKTSLKRLSEGLIQDMEPELLGQAMNYALKQDFLDEPSVSKYVEVLYDAKPGDITSVAADLATQGTSAERPSIGRQDFNPLALSDVEDSERAAIRKNIGQALSSQLGISVRRDADGNFLDVYADDDASGRILENAVQYYLAETRDVFKQRSSTEVYNEIFEKVNTGIEAFGGKLDLLSQTPFDGPMVPAGEVPAGEVTGTSGVGANDNRTSMEFMTEKQEKETDYFSSEYLGVK